MLLVSLINSSSHKMESATQIQLLDEADCVSLRAKAIGKNSICSADLWVKCKADWLFNIGNIGKAISREWIKNMNQNQIYSAWNSQCFSLCNSGILQVSFVCDILLISNQILFFNIQEKSELILLNMTEKDLHCFHAEKKLTLDLTFLKMQQVWYSHDHDLLLHIYIIHMLNTYWRNE